MRTMQNYPKHIKRQLRELATTAYAEELKRALIQVADSVDAWRNGQIDVWELDRRSHAYHDGPARELYKEYENAPVDMLVAYAIVRGILAEESIPAETLSYLERPLTFYRLQELDDQERRED